MAEPQAAASKEPRVARGRALKWTATAIADLSTLNDERRADAAAAWRRHADPAFRTLIDAEVIES